jgi:hypothetical protein
MLDLEQLGSGGVHFLTLADIKHKVAAPHLFQLLGVFTTFFKLDINLLHLRQLDLQVVKSLALGNPITSTHLLLLLGSMYRLLGPCIKLLFPILCVQSTCSFMFQLGDSLILERIGVVELL